MEPVKKNFLVTRRKENRQIRVWIFTLNFLEIKQERSEKVPVIYVVFVIDYSIRDQFTFLAKVILRALVSPGRTLRFDGKETTACNRLLFHRACAST